MTELIARLKASHIELCRLAADELERLTDSFPYCDKHKPNGGKRAGCLECAYIECSAALSRISYLCGEPNDMEYSHYDADYDAQAVVKQLERMTPTAEENAVAAESVGILEDGLNIAKHGKPLLLAALLRKYVLREKT